MTNPLRPTLPRRDLQENAFRKYEPFIARGITESYELDTGSLSADTFVARFNDAKLGYRRYGYISDVIPTAYDISFIQARTIDDRTVLVANNKSKLTTLNATVKKGTSTVFSSNLRVDGVYGYLAKAQPFLVSKDKTTIATLAQLMHDNFIVSSIVIVAKDSDEMQWLDNLEQHHYPNICLASRSEDNTRWELYTNIWREDDLPASTNTSTSAASGSSKEQDQKHANALALLKAHGL